LRLSNNSPPQLQRTAELLHSSNNSADFLPPPHYSLDLLLERNKNSHPACEARLLLLQSNNYRLRIIQAVAADGEGIYFVSDCPGPFPTELTDIAGFLTFHMRKPLNGIQCVMNEVRVNL